MKFKHGKGNIQKSFMNKNKNVRLLNQSEKDTPIYMSIQTTREIIKQLLLYD